MEQKIIDRINALAKKSKDEGLTDLEKKEQQALRQQYISDFKKSLVSVLDQVVIVDPNGKQSKLKKNNTPKQ